MTRCDNLNEMSERLHSHFGPVTKVSDMTNIDPDMHRYKLCYRRFYRDLEIVFPYIKDDPSPRCPHDYAEFFMLMRVLETRDHQFINRPDLKEVDPSSYQLLRFSGFRV